MSVPSLIRLDYVSYAISNSSMCIGYISVRRIYVFMIESMRIRMETNSNSARMPILLFIMYVYI